MSNPDCLIPQLLIYKITHICTNTIEFVRFGLVITINEKLNCLVVCNTVC